MVYIFDVSASGNPDTTRHLKWVSSREGGKRANVQRVSVSQTSVTDLTVC